MGRRKKEKLNILKLSLGHQESSGLMGTVIAEMPGKTISELSALPKRTKWIKHLSSCVGSKNNYSVIYYCKKGLISAKLSEKKAFKFYAFVAVGGFDLDGLNESLCVCVNVTTCQISKGLRSLNTAAFELWENSDSWPACILAQQTEPKTLPKHTQDCEKFSPVSNLWFHVCCCPKQAWNGLHRPSVWHRWTNIFPALVWKGILLQLHNELSLQQMSKAKLKKFIFHPRFSISWENKLFVNI